MASTEVKKYLFDITEALDAIEFARLQVPDIETLETNRLLRSSIERELLIIGEAATNIFKIAPDINITDLKNIRATRNIIVHDYTGVNYKIIWNIIVNHLPALKEEVIELLADDKPQK